MGKFYINSLSLESNLINRDLMFLSPLPEHEGENGTGTLFLLDR